VSVPSLGMETKELGYVVCGLACVAILAGAIMYGTPGGILLIVGVLVIAGWFLGLWRQRSPRR
jgi:hypothetical protein